MQSHNPAFRNDRAFAQGGYASFDTDRRSGGQAPRWGGSGAGQDVTPEQLQEMYAQPSAGGPQTGRMTYDDVVVRTGALFALLVASAATVWFVLPIGTAAALAIPALLVATGLGLWASISKKVRVGAMLAYAVLMGAALGGLSSLFELQFPGIVVQAVLGTMAAFGVMLVLYKTRVVRNSPKLTRFLAIAGGGYFVFLLVNLGVSIFTGASAFDSPFGWLIGLFGVGLASFFLILDFDYVEQGVKNGLPQQYAWRAAFGLITTIVWLYIEMIRLLSILRGGE
jgi:uncharacterized YccA/Bax inhibitor family protein